MKSISYKQEIVDTKRICTWEGSSGSPQDLVAFHSHGGSQSKGLISVTLPVVFHKYNSF